VPALPTNLNPWTPQGSNPVTAEVTAGLWPSAFVTGPAGGEQPETAFVSSAEVVGVPPASKFTVQYQINPKAVWSDGVPITAADFAYLWQQLRRPSDLPSTVPVTGYDDISSLVGSNRGRTVTVTFSTPDAGWEDLFQQLVPEHIGAEGGFSGAFSRPGATSPVSGGPFVVSKVVPGQSLTLVRNPRWWGVPARLDEIVFEVVRGSSAVIRDLQDGAVDLAELGPSAALTDDVLASRDLDERSELSPTMWQLVYNEADPLFAHRSIRLAFSDALDRRELEWDTVGLEDPAVELAVNHLFAAGAGGAGDDDGAYQLGNDAAVYDLLAGDGFSRDADGLITTTTGAPLELRIVGPSRNALARRIETLLRAQLLDAGITLHVSNVPLHQLLAGVLPTGDYQLALAPYLVAPSPQQNVQLYADPVGPLEPLTVASPGVPLPASDALLSPPTPGAEPGAAVAGSVTRDVMGYDDPEIGALAAQAFSELNPADEVGLYNRIDSLLWSDLPTMPLFQSPLELVTRDDLVNVTYATTWEGPFWDASQWGLQVSPPPVTTTTLP
jgi:peptide/nickel transport system substrate-binding protein